MEKKNEVFEYKGLFYEIEMDPHESREMFMERVWFIFEHLKEINQLDEIIRKSRIWINKKILGCEFKNIE
jgi:hypothetical protein